jgi:hypothetical protein
LYFSSNKGYPSSAAGTPADLVPNFASVLPTDPQPADGLCATTAYPAPVPAGNLGGQYYYVATGTSYLAPDNITTVFSNFYYYFCLGNQTGIFAPGVHFLTGVGVQ